jgi:hypothetical protein
MASESRRDFLKTAGGNAAGGQATLRLPLLAQGRWYDTTVRVEGDALFTRRFAGRLEDGTPASPTPPSARQAPPDPAQAHDRCGRRPPGYKNKILKPGES